MSLLIHATLQYIIRKKPSFLHNFFVFYLCALSQASKIGLPFVDNFGNYICSNISCFINVKEKRDL